MEVNFKLRKNVMDGSVTLEANYFDLFTFFVDGSTLAHSHISHEITGLDVTKKFERVKLTKE